MPRITLELPARGIDGICGNNDYQETVGDGKGGQIPNPQTKVQFVKAHFEKMWRDNTKTYEYNQGEQTRRKTINQEVDGLE